MVIDVEESKTFLENTHEFGVLVKDDRVAKTVPENDAHEGGCKCFSGSVRNWFHRSKGTHSTAGDKILGTFETFDGTGLVVVDMEDHHRCLNWEVINQLTRFGFGWVK
jgi:cell division FtsZ-interacting protein ZapD